MKSSTTKTEKVETVEQRFERYLKQTPRKVAYPELQETVKKAYSLCGERIDLVVVVDSLRSGPRPDGNTNDPLMAALRYVDLGQWTFDITRYQFFNLGYFGTCFIGGAFRQYADRMSKGVVSNPVFEQIEKLLDFGVWDMEKTGNTAIVFMRPEEIHFDEQGRFHCATGPAIRYRSGTEYFRWHNTEMKKNEIEDPNSLVGSEIIKESNIERRRALMEIFGYERLLAGVQYEVLDKDVDGGGQPRRLLKINVPGGVDNPNEAAARSGRWGTQTFDENLVLVEVSCPSTGHNYILRVPPTMKNCADAVAWTYSETKETYKPLKEA